MTAPARPTCFRCGEPITPGARFCMKCGSDVSGEQGGVATAMMPASSERDANDALLEVLRQATIGEYEIHKELGRGGMATVYLAHDIALDRKVAIKVMSPALLLMGEGMAERFKREARTAANLSHPNIIPIYTVKSAGKTLFFVMKFIAGRSLESIIHEIGPMPIPVVRAILQQVGNALGYAHRNGIIHRDVKPANIMIDEEGWSVVTDFGIAKVAENRGLTMTGIAVGTPSYMSPEQCAAKDITGKSDQYSLGVVAYEMLTGKQPFEGDSAMSIMFQHFHEQPRPIGEVRGDTPEALASAVMRMLEKSPDKRWGSMEEAITAIGGQALAHDDPAQVNLIAVVRRGSNRELLRGTTPPTSPVPPARTRPVADAATTPIPAPRIVGLTISPNRSDLHVGDSLALTATPRVAGGTSAGGTVSWSSSDPAIATVTDAGQVTARAPGAVTITGTCEAVRATAEITVTRVPVASIGVEPVEPTLHEGESLQLVAHLRDRNGAAADDREVRWRAVPGPVVDVTGTGRVTARREGVAEVLAESEGVSGSTRIQVLPRPVAAVRVTPAEGGLSVGETLSLSVEVTDAGGGKLERRSVAWRSSAEAVATVSDRGVVTGQADGTAEITAECEGHRAVARVKVTPVPVGSVTITQPPPLVVGERVALEVVIKDGRGRPLSGRSVKWASSSPGVATVTQGGQLTGMTAGSARVTAECEGKSWTVTATVQPVPVAEVVLEAVPTELAVEATATLRASARDAKGAVLAGREAKWESDRAKVASVSPAGVVTGRAPGQAVITAKIEGKSASATITVAAAALTEARTEVIPPVVVAAPEVAERPAVSPVPAPALAPRPPVPAPAPEPSAPAPAHSGGRGKLIGGAVALIAVAGVAYALMRGGGEEPIPPAPAPPPVVAVAVQSVSVAGVNGPVTVGRTLQLSAVVKGPAGEELSSRVITWTSSDPAVAEVTPVGAVTARKAGEVTITAASEGKSGRATLTVLAPESGSADQPAAVASVTVSGPASRTLDVGGTAQLQAALKDAKGATLTDRTVVWTSSDPRVVTATSAGLVTATGAGSARIVANSEGRSAEVRFTVNAPPEPEPPVVAPAPAPVAVQSVAVTPPEADIPVGGAVALAAVVLDAKGNALTDRTIAWRSSDERIARVDQQGGVSGVGKGTATISAGVEGKSASARVTVSVAAAVSSVVITAPTRALKVGETATWTAITRDKGGNTLEGRAVAWSSSAPGVATVTPAGVITAIGPGTAEIRAESEGKRAVERLTVTAPPPPVVVAPTPAPAQPSPAQPGPAQPGPATAGNLLPRRGVEAGGALSCGIAAQGVVCWGAGEGGLVAIEGTAGVTAVAVGRAHACALVSGGRAVCWGDNRVGQLGDGGSAPSTSAVEVAGGLSFSALTAGAQHTCGLAGGKAYCWGRGRDGQLGEGSTGDRKRPVAVRGGKAFTAISAGGNHTCAITAAGAAYCWGDGFSGQLGFGAQESQREPIDVSGGLKFSRIAAGGKHSCGVSTAGKAYCWGANESGQLGDGSKNDRSVPTEVSGGPYAEIAAGGGHSCALDPGGAAYCWGDNKSGQLGDGGKSGRDKPVAVSGGTGFSGISAGEDHTCGMTRGGEAVCWGRNDKGQLGDGGTTARSAPGPVRQR